MPLLAKENRFISFIDYDGEDVNAAKATESIQNIRSLCIIGMPL